MASSTIARSTADAFVSPRVRAEEVRLGSESWHEACRAKA